MFYLKVMFSGLIEKLGEVCDVEMLSDGVRLRITTSLSSELSSGESVAVNGVCLTVASLDASSFWSDVSPETARVTTLGRIIKGSVVNLERPLRADSRLGGHFVLGHVDGIGEIDAIKEESEFYKLVLRYPPSIGVYIVNKGSIAVDGISLTVAGLYDDRLEVQIVPHTWKCTNLHAAKVDDLINLECDIIGKYVVRTTGSLRTVDS